MTHRRHRQVADFPKCACLGSLLLAACAGDGTGGMGSPGAARRVTLTGRAAGGVPTALTWVAFQDGDGPWQRASDSAGVYTFDALSGRYNAAFVCATDTVRSGEVIAAAVAELDTIEVPCPVALPGAARLRWSGTLTGIAAGLGDLPDVTFSSKEGGATRALVSSDGSSYTIDLPAGTYDLVTSVAGNRLNVKRDIRITAAGSTNVDFSTGTVMAKSQPLPAIAADAQESLETGAFFTSARGVRVDLFAPKGSVALLDPADLGPGDTQQIYGEARGAKSAFRGFFRAVPGGPVPALALPPPLGGASAVPVTGVQPPLYVRPRISFDAYPNVRFYQANIFTDLPDMFVWVMNVGPQWLAGRTSFELPDWTGVAGWNPAWGPPLDRPLAALVTAVAGNRGFGPILHDLPPSPGDEIGYGKEAFTITVSRP